MPFNSGNAIRHSLLKMSAVTDISTLAWQPVTQTSPAKIVRSGVQVIDPTQEAGWNNWLESNSAASFFHTSAWARVLQDSYGHHPFYFCSVQNGVLKSLLPVMDVRSAVTGHRGVALPFTDFAAPFTAEPKQYRELFAAALEHGRANGWSWFECRGGDLPADDAHPSLSFFGHQLDLTVGEKRMFENLDSAVRRAIRKAQGAGLVVRFSTNEEAMRDYYLLHSATRRRHGLPPQPYRFFENIARHALARGLGFIASITLDSETIASAIFLHYKRQAIYKFGASDLAFQHLRPNNLLMWEAIRRCAGMGMESLHFGRTSLANEGLRRFKLGFGACEARINYYKYNFARKSFVSETDRAEGWHNLLFRCLPGPLLRLAGRFLYPHMS